MNPFRQLLKASRHRVPIGTWITSASPIVAEAVGHAGFDWGVIDMEHTTIDMMGVLHALQAISTTKMVSVVSVPSNDPVTVKRVLDAGALTLMFPMIESADDARKAVSATRYPPAGHRGLSAMNRASRYGTLPNYVRLADASQGVIVQLETQAALRRARGGVRCRRCRRGVRRAVGPVRQPRPWRAPGPPRGHARDGYDRATLSGHRHAGGHGGQLDRAGGAIPCDGLRLHRRRVRPGAADAWRT